MLNVKASDESVTAGGYGCRDGRCMVQLYSVAARGGAGVAGVQLRVIGYKVGQDEKSSCAAAQKDTTVFYEFLFAL